MKVSRWLMADGRGIERGKKGSLLTRWAVLCSVFCNFLMEGVEISHLFCRKLQEGQLSLVVGWL